MLSHLVFSTATRTATRRATLSNARVSNRFMSADSAAHHESFKPKSDLPWIIGAVAITGPIVSPDANNTGAGNELNLGFKLAYLIKDTVAIKQKISARHHGHSEHEEHV